jgi:hypothetical protein
MDLSRSIIMTFSRPLLFVLALSLGLGTLSCSRVAVMMIINASGSPVTVTLGSLSPYIYDGTERDPDSTWAVGDTTYRSFRLAPIDSLVVASEYHMRAITYDEMPFEFLGIRGDGIEIASRDAAIMSLFPEQDGDLILTLRPRLPKQIVVGSRYRGKPGATLVRGTFMDGGKAEFDYRGDSTLRVRVRRDGDSLVFMKNDDTLVVGMAYVGHRYLDLSPSMSPDTSRRLFMSP